MIYNASHRVATTYTDSLQFDNISYSVYIEYDCFNPVYLTHRVVINLNIQSLPLCTKFKINITAL